MYKWCSHFRTREKIYNKRKGGDGNGRDRGQEIEEVDRTGVIKKVIRKLKKEFIKMI